MLKTRDPTRVYLALSAGLAFAFALAYTDCVCNAYKSGKRRFVNSLALAALVRLPALEIVRRAGGKKADSVSD
ncbi:hypothetical protein [Deinococcus arenicola]|uniref:Uncharacterized protein n=1 Tax=Deinococcus arenicola TaxID=2994950 RepID=A0ABU4DQL1_9DEIO|nr:hypothetical protein [Deinococcus sp. ZS9-10]MDV6374731.1 hypothetical protein [Deinococcus sp. ZS9-10]